MTPRPSLRWRLTALYGGLFFAAGGLLVAANFALVRESLPADQIVFSTRVKGPVDDSAFIGVIGGIGGSKSMSARVEDPGPAGVAGPGVDGPAQVFIEGKPADAGLIKSLPGQLRSSALRGLLSRSFIALGVVGIGSLVLGWYLAGRALRPIHRITDTARRLSETNLDERIAMDGPNDELKELADTFDAMLGRLDSAFDSQRRFVANASHELRTPLAIMRAQLEVARTPKELRAASDVVQQTIERSERLLDGLLVLARADGQLSLQPTDLADALRSVGSTCDAEGIELTVLADPAPVDGDPALLLHLARNLIDNACRHNVPGGWVAAVTRLEGGQAVLEVSNGGPNIDPAVVETLFEPFRRLSPDRTGGDSSAGLGLSIVRAVARAHGGDASADALSTGGLRVEVRLPAALATVSDRLAGVVQRQNISFPS
ncbi:MAG: integral rane sensor signal transduction histidine kinase [Actinomycetia bacterium]|nr:integral rane sensor signal transduction histidine kinase [Actinomycetes bacterium]